MEQNTLCKFDFETLPIEYHSQYPFTTNDVFVYLGDIKQMRGHCVVIRLKDNQIFTCCHTDNFIEIPEDEC